jgi:hypothetical protein
MKTINVFPNEFTPVTASETLQINGGGFAYDVGFALRFMALSLGTPYTRAEAIFEAIILYAD